ncbi:substrate-binding periplasmic protein [Alteromonas oceanisediminis]|uniref:substrate-binding periplasmic protein n=1 Tax=Alteromonas oceanisediminis TaxID=2836180 RepID=UPI001BD91894|nr:transporter substrate-binding domain-containing protein [Alteromonas oceanisediminis]MBT0585402.1 transporter substrate-binding domain-containing protein [Alteromonas oceanisediminis]
MIFRHLASATTLIIYILMTSLLSNPLQASPQKLVVGAQNIYYFPHYDFKSESDKGIAWAILQSFGKAYGYDIEYLPLPIKRMHHALEMGQIDFIFPDNRTWYESPNANAKKFFSQPFYEILGGAFVLQKNREFTPSDVKTLSIPFGFSPVKWHERIASGQVVLADVSESFAALNLVVAGRADATDLEYNVIKYLTQNQPKYSDIVIGQHLPYDIVGFHLSTIKYPAVIRELDSFLEQNASLIAELKEKYNLVDPHAEVRNLGLPAHQ